MVTEIRRPNAFYIYIYIYMIVRFRDDPQTLAE